MTTSGNHPPPRRASGIKSYQAQASPGQPLSDAVVTDPTSLAPGRLFDTREVWTSGPTDLAQATSRELRTDRPHSARVYNYWLDGKDNFPADREVAERVVAQWPGVRTSARENRKFLHRAVRLLARRGIRQFLDVGTGLPLAPNTHEIAQRVDPDARVVYVDNDPMVLAHARALLTGNGPGAIRYVEEDLLHPETVLSRAAQVLDLRQPVAVLMLAVLHFVPAPEEVRALVASYLGPLPSGSAVVISHGCADNLAPETAQNVAQLYRQSGIEGAWASNQEISELFGQVELLDPGVVPVSRWRRQEGHCPPDGDIALFGGIGVKP
ncbi:SAM-dependent methyltransferase [Streptacidiphilus sp. MAP5-3]|uniref:SAM-dependent methyltransferase n=1 Tax=unclassified Streptacidiphilus TaxID=2643834 RepID=UPI003516412C